MFKLLKKESNNGNIYKTYIDKSGTKLSIWTYDGIFIKVKVDLSEKYKNFEILFDIENNKLKARIKTKKSILTSGTPARKLLNEMESIYEYCNDIMSFIDGLEN